MAKSSVFKSAKAEVKKKKVVLINAELDDALKSVEKRAETLGISFPVNEHLERALHRLVTQAVSELDLLDSELDQEAPNDEGIAPSQV